MESDGDSRPFRLALLLGLGAVVLMLLGFGGWFLTRSITPGGFVVRVAPSGVAPGGLVVSLLGPGGGKLGDWRFLDVPGPTVLAGLEKKIPWTAVATNASARRPCLTLETAPFVSEAALAPIERLALAQCCPGVTEVARCPIRRVVLGR
jgi:hypothetical protein